jgi:SAM-dependent methyltransferase
MKALFEHTSGDEGATNSLALNQDYVERLITRYGPQADVTALVLEVNRIYHSFEAHDYDRLHHEITSQLPPLWEKMLALVNSHAASSSWHVLDFGCGTGFEAEQMLRNIPCERIAKLVCYDPSPEMLERCRARIAPLFPNAVFLGDLGSLTAEYKGNTFNLLATNSLLHHLPDPIHVVKSLLQFLSQDAFWIAGHEPSSRFYANQACLAVYEAYLRERRWKRFLTPDTYLVRLEMALGRRSNPPYEAAREAHRRGLFTQVPPAWVIQRLVDFHVAHSATEAASGRGLDFEQLERDFAGAWSLQWVQTYAYLGPYLEEGLQSKWSRVCRDLRAKYPLDGANFCSVWSRNMTWASKQ